MWGKGEREFFDESILLLYDEETGTKETPLHATTYANTLHKKGASNYAQVGEEFLVKVLMFEHSLEIKIKYFQRAEVKV